jgi:hypothetical protein
MSSFNSHSVALLADKQVIAHSDALADLQNATLAQLKLLRGLRREEALRSLLVGAALLRIKASLDRGTWMPWVQTNITDFGQRYVNYLMRLALAFFEKSRIEKSELLALPGEQLDLAVEGKEGAQRRFLEKAMKFVGQLSLAELLEKYGIKETKKLGGAREPGEKTPSLPATAEQMYLQSRDEIGGAIERAENLLLKENILQHLAGHPEEIRGVVDALRSLASKVEAAAAPMLKAVKAN